VATIASLLRDRVTLQVRSVDRLFLQGYVPKLMTPFQVVRFLLDRGNPIPSPALLGKIGRAYVAAIDRFAADNAVAVVHFGKGESKEQIARQYFRAAEREDRFGVVLIGVAQERTTAWRGFRRGGSDSHPHFEFARQRVCVNHYYFYIRDRDWGPGFIKTCAYAPFPVWVYLNGHEWAKRQAEQAGIAFQALDNGFASVADTDALGAITNRLTAREVWHFFDRWQARLPSPFDAADRRRGYRYQLAFRQLELSDTRVFDRPAAGRAWFEQTIRDQLTLGRPDNIAIVFGRRVSRCTPGRFHTRVITRGVQPAIQVGCSRSAGVRAAPRGLRCPTRRGDRVRCASQAAARRAPRATAGSLVADARRERARREAVAADPPYADRPAPQRARRAPAAPDAPRQRSL
jgi:hypothetical protein